MSVDAAFKFLQNFSGRREFCQRIYDTIHKDLKENARSMLSHQGFEAFISILRWCAPLNKVEAFKNILRTLYFTITMKGVDSLQFPEYIALKTRLEHDGYPFDKVVFKRGVRASCLGQETESSQTGWVKQRMPLSSRVAVHTSQLVDEQLIDYGRSCLVNEVRLLFDKQDAVFKL